jgi:hypothetical protein
MLSIIRSCHHLSTLCGSAARVIAFRMKGRLLAAAAGVVSFCLCSRAVAQLNMDVTFPGPGLPAGVTASGTWVSVPSGSVVRVPAAPAGSTVQGVFDLGSLGGGRAMGTTDIEAHFIRQGTSGAVSSAVAITLVQPAVPVSSPDPIAGSSAAFCRLTETGGNVFLKMFPDAVIPGPGFSVPGEIANRYGSLLKLRLKWEPQQDRVEVYINDELYGVGAIPDPFESAGGRVRAVMMSSATRYYDLQRVTAAAVLWTGVPELLELPQSFVLRFGYQGSLRVRTNDPLVTTYQWQRRRPSDPGFLNYAATGATTATLPFGVGDDDGTLYRAVVTTPTGLFITDPVTVTHTNLTVPFNAPLDLNFNGGTSLAAAGTGADKAALVGFANIRNGTGSDGSGALWLSDGQLGQLGALIVNDLNGAAGEGGFLANFRVRVDGGTIPPADGFSLSWGTDVPAAPGPSAWEEGLGTKLRVAFDFFDNGEGEAPAVDIFWGDSLRAHVPVPLEWLYTGSNWAGIAVRMGPSGHVDVAINNRIIHWQVRMPGNTNQSGARWALAARTGGLSASMRFDDIQIVPYDTTPFPVILVHPQPFTTHEGGRAKFSITLARPQDAVIRWRLLQPNLSTDIVTGTSTTLEMTARYAGNIVADILTGAGEITSSPAALTLTGRPGLSVDNRFAWDDTAIPAGAALSGNAAWQPTTRAGDSSSILLTSAAAGQQGTFILPDLDGGEKVKSLFARFEVRVRQWSNPPADGWSFSWAPDLPATPFGEEGAGSGLRVSFDTYDNNDGFPRPEAPAVTVFWKGVQVADVPLNIAELLTAEDWAPVTVYVSSGGRLTIQYRGLPLVTDLQLASHAGFAGAKFGWAARTGLFYAEHSVRRIELGTVREIPQISMRRWGTRGVIVEFEGVLDSTWISGDIQQWFFESAQSPFYDYFPVPNDPKFPYYSRKFYRAWAP